MATFNEKDHLIGTAEYNTNFWNVMRGNRYAAEKIHDYKDSITGGYNLPAALNTNLKTAITHESLFRNIATVVKAYNGPSHILAKSCDELASWIPENGIISIQEGLNDFTNYDVDLHKLAVFIKMDNVFVNDATFDIESYLTSRLAKNFAKAEDYGFISGAGDYMPTGILNQTGGAEVGVYTNRITYDDITRLYFSLNEEYRQNAVWLMNDNTALALRLLKNAVGDPLWNQTNNTILGKPVFISNDMPSEEAGKAPIVFGDFSYYWLIERSPVSIQTLNEKYVMLDQIGYLAVEFLDGKLIRREAIKTLTINNM